MKRCSGISNLISESTNRYILLSDVAIETSKTTVIQSEEDIFHGNCDNVIGLVVLTCQSTEDNFSNILKKIKDKESK